MTHAPTPPGHRPSTADRGPSTADRGTWSLGPVRLRIYDLIAGGRTVTDEIAEIARIFLDEEALPRIEATGEADGAGFVTIRHGDLELPIRAHWWVRGSVLCQHVHRHRHDDAGPLDAASHPAIGCLRELEIVAAEVAAWRDTMMTEHPGLAGDMRRRAA